MTNEVYHLLEQTFQQERFLFEHETQSWRIVLCVILRTQCGHESPLITVVAMGKLGQMQESFGHAVTTCRWDNCACEGRTDLWKARTTTWANTPAFFMHTKQNKHSDASPLQS